MSKPRRTGEDRPLRERGQAAAEFTLIAPILFITLFGIIQMGVLFGRQLDLKSATRDGARRAAVSMHNADPVSIAKTRVKRSLVMSDPNSVQITVTPPPPWTHGDRVTVHSKVPHAYNILGVTRWSGDLEAKSVIRVE